MLKLLHTADWHLGKRFPSFPEEAQKRLTRARLDVVDSILALASRNRVDAVLCAGDLFDSWDPLPDWWRGLAERLARHKEMPPVFLVPGNHDPLQPNSVWWPTHPFRAALPKWAHVVDRDDFSFELKPDAVLLSAPCRSTAGSKDLALSLPAREPGDTRVRIGCVHGSTFDIEGYQTNFPISKHAGVSRGLDYLAIGDTHAFRDVTPDLAVPTVYPSAPEQTAFDETESGYVALVGVFAHGSGRKPRVDRERVGYWLWREEEVLSLADLRGILSRADLVRTVFRLQLKFSVTISEESEVERILHQLEGTEVNHGAAGVLVYDKTELQLSASVPEDFEKTLPPVLQDAVSRLRKLNTEGDTQAERDIAGRALTHLFKALQRDDSGGPP